MIIDNIINDLDSSTYHTAEYHDPDLELFFIRGGVRFVFGVSEGEFLELCREPNDETLLKLFADHQYRDFYGH